MTFKVGITRDLLNARGEPCFNARALDVLEANRDIAWEWVKEDLCEVTPEIAQRYHGLHLNLPRVTPASVARADCRLKVIARNGVGYDTVDIPAVTAKGIVLTNTPVAVRRPVAVATLTLIFALAGRLFKKNEIVRRGRWNDRTEHMGQGLTTRTLGLVGAGGVGQEILRVARPFFKRMIAADPYADKAAVGALGADIVPIDQVMRDSDFVVVCCLLSPETHHLIDDRRLALMKPSAYFLNVGRGPITDEKALVRALEEKRILGAGLDVTEREPIEMESPLIGMENVIITPHALCWTDECFHEIAATALQSIVDVSLGRRPRHVVNPQVYERGNRQ
jgi:D-3-phosphoglycerate dehydrogenase